jgi:hypothetical protein
MDKTPLPISDLLALRDGELREAKASADDPQVQAQVKRLHELRDELQSLPDVPISEVAWQQITAASRQRRRGAGTPGHWLRYPLATAASVFFASLLGIYLMFGGQVPIESGAAPTAAVNTAPQLQAGGLQLAGLMNRSRELELRLRGVQPLAPASDVLPADAEAVAAPSPVERQLMGRLADVDTQIARMFESGIQDPQLRERLWAQRVSLLESLVAVRGGQSSDLFEDGRSM